MTNWKDGPIGNFVIHKAAEEEDGYNYYLYIHPRGESIIMRTDTAGTEFLYADGGRNGADWEDRDTLSYDNYSKLD